jgi:NAD(P)-dependent dehydrogenase (short-subunit alcohol dehydrogenase family)
MRSRSLFPLLAFSAGLALAHDATKRRNRYDLRNKNVLITGGSRGLGLALAREFAGRGARVTICARDPEELLQATSQLDRLRLKVESTACDITQEAAVAALIRELEDRNGPLDVLVNNAGRIEVGPLEAATTQDFERAMATHFWGPLYLMRQVIPGMRRKGAGRIVNISSIGGKIGMPHLIPYDSSKFALAGLSEAITSEIRKNNIFVTTAYPGLMRTGSPRNANFKGKHRKEYAWFTISDSMPMVTIGAARAARKIVDACRDGRASLVITPAAKLVALAHAIAPNMLINALAMVNWLLPKADGGNTRSHSGSDSQTPLTQSPVTLLDQRAANDLNQ